MDKLRRLYDSAADVAQLKLKTGENEFHRAANDVSVRAQQVAAEAADAAKRRLQLKAEEAKEATKKKTEDVQKAAMRKAEETRAAAATKARGIGNKMLHSLRNNQEYATRQLNENAKILQRSTSDTVDDLKKRAWKSVVEVTGAAQERVSFSVSKSAERLKHTSSSAVEAIDLRGNARRVRNKLLTLGFVGIFLYGFGSAMPFAMAKYAVERGKLEEAVAQTDATATSAEKK
ncbi:unnamed protein product [Peronospora farinosa]|uniref:Uncharacterized protein n=1 Tax=Peronospora farinosa TaxID=134698 RepID=A0AAV0SW91_9STRA|nr:unnamed protein product [Peronospora farinosa]CAI5709638.1 unnamed protein product [Peronospora farinosa]